MGLGLVMACLEATSTQAQGSDRPRGRGDPWAVVTHGSSRTTPKALLRSGFRPLDALALLFFLPLASAVRSPPSEGGRCCPDGLSPVAAGAGW